MQFGVNMKIYIDQCTLAGGHAARVCDGHALRRPSLRNVFRLGGGAACSSQRRPRPGTHFRSPSVLSCELCECRGVRTDTISLDSPAGFVDACCQAVVSTLCSAPASAALGLDALTHVSCCASGDAAFTTSMKLGEVFDAVLAAVNAQTSEGKQALAQPNRRAGQALRDLLSRVRPEWLARLPVGTDLGPSGPALAEHRLGVQQVVLLGAADAAALKEELVRKLQLWGFSCAMVSSGCDALFASHFGRDRGIASNTTGGCECDGDAVAVAAGCQAAVLVLTRGLVQCARTRVRTPLFFTTAVCVCLCVCLCVCVCKRECVRAASSLCVGACLCRSNPSPLKCMSRWC